MIELSLERLDEIYYEIFFKLSDDMKNAHKYWKSETNDFTDFSSINEDQGLSIVFNKYVNFIFTAYETKRPLSVITYPTGRTFVGKNFDPSFRLDIPEISRLIKQEIRINYPKSKISVKSDSFSGGSSIDVTISSLGYNPFTKEFIKFFKNGNDPEEWHKYLDSQGVSLNYEYVERTFIPQFNTDYRKIQEIRNQYNYDNSDPMTDYFSVLYYGSANYYFSDLAVNAFPDSDYAKEKKKAEHDRKKAEKEKSQKLKAKRDAFKFKKWDLATYTGRNEKVHIVAVTRVPNGRARFSSYDIVQLMPLSSMKPERQNEILNQKGKYKVLFESDGVQYGVSRLKWSNVAEYHLTPFGSKSEAKTETERQRGIEILKLKYKYKK